MNAPAVSPILAAIGSPLSLLPAGVVERLGWVLVHSLWQFTLVAVVAAILIRLLRQCSADIRHGVLVAALALAPVAPLLTWLRLSTLEPTVSKAVSTAGDLNAVHTEQISVPTLAVNPQNVQPVKQAVASTATKVEMATLAEPPAAPATSAVPQWRDSLQAGLRPWLTWIVAGWGLGVALCSLRPLLGCYTLWKLQRIGLIPVTEETRLALQRVASRLGLRQVAQVMQSTLVQIPLLAGYFKPVILLPASLLANISPAQLEAILAHELAHLRRRDFLVNLLQTVFETLLFYHPAVWWLSRQIRVEREHCCDDVVVALLGNRLEYGRALLAVEELRGRGTLLALGATDGSLLSRVRRILGRDPSGSRLTDRWPAAAGLVLLAVACVVAVNWGASGANANDDPKPPVAQENVTGKGTDVKVLSEAFGEALKHQVLPFLKDEQIVALRQDFEAKVGPQLIKPLTNARREQLRDAVVVFVNREFDPAEGESTYLEFGNRFETLLWELRIAIARPELTTDESARQTDQRNWMRAEIQRLPESAKYRLTHKDELERLELLLGDVLNPFFQEPWSEADFTRVKSEFAKAMSADRSDLRLLQASNRLYQAVLDVRRDKLLQQWPVANRGSQRQNLRWSLIVMPQVGNSSLDLPDLNSRREGIYADVMRMVHVAEEAPADLSDRESWLNSKGQGDLAFDAKSAELVGIRGAKLAVLPAASWYEGDQVPLQELQKLLQSTGQSSLPLTTFMEPEGDPANGILKVRKRAPSLVVQTAEGKVAVIRFLGMADGPVFKSHPRPLAPNPPLHAGDVVAVTPDAGDSPIAQPAAKDEAVAVEQTLRAKLPVGWTLIRDKLAFELRGPHGRSEKSNSESARITFWFSERFASSTVLDSRDQTLPRIGSWGMTRLGQLLFTRNDAALELWPEFLDELYWVLPVDHVVLAGEVNTDQIVEHDDLSGHDTTLMELMSDVGTRIDVRLDAAGKRIPHLATNHFARHVPASGVAKEVRFLVMGKIPNVSAAKTEVDWLIVKRHLAEAHTMIAAARANGTRILSVANYVEYLKQRRRQAHVKAVPGLSDLPVVGRVFQYDMPAIKDGNSIEVPQVQMAAKADVESAAPAATGVSELITAQIESLQGKWKHTTTAGWPSLPGQAKAPADVAVEFKGEEILLTGVNGFDVKYSYKVDPAGDPKQIDITPLDERFKGSTYLGVYGLKGDELWIALSEPGSMEKRPADFKLVPGRVVLVLEPVDRPAPEKYQSATYMQKKLSTKIPDSLWGKTRDGMRMAVVVREAGNTEWNYLPEGTNVPASLTVRHGEQIGCQLLVENVSDHDINVTSYSYTEVGRSVEVFDRQADSVPINTIHILLPVNSTCWKLKPGERDLLQMPPIQFVEKPTTQGVGYFATTGSGEHILRIGYTFGDLSKDAIQPIENKEEWTGQLTAAIKVNVLADDEEPQPDAEPAVKPAPAAPIPVEPSRNNAAERKLDEQSSRIVSRSAPAIVTVTKRAAPGAATLSAWRHSGVVFDPRGLILTTGVAKDFEGGTLTVRLADDRELAATYMASNDQRGLVVLRVSPPQPLPTVELERGAAKPYEGLSILAVPSPTWKGSFGTVSALQQDLGDEFPKNLIQTDLSLPLGESGGLMVNQGGSPVGLWYAVRAGSQKLSFAIPLKQATPLVTQALDSIDVEDRARRNELSYELFIPTTPPGTLIPGQLHLMRRSHVVWFEKARDAIEQDQKSLLQKRRDLGLEPATAADIKVVVTAAPEGSVKSLQAWLTLLQEAGFKNISVKAPNPPPAATKAASP